MPRFRANARFGPWRKGDEFESNDEFHLQLAASSSVLSEIGASEEEAETVDSPVDETPEDAEETDGPSEEKEPQVEDSYPWQS